ncbi:small GTP-binding protein domain-containing protein [Marinococcus luteus]|uniref:Small GTP-binding protein domain-containing protein n=1 Tax=Marinococcus luteus TaxID=1122204 RepID=A0A1H2R350_9BACI|nr:dynamin family protein [Marinococcus luteus]SDW13882.1 small GTP-binding protein domain-containing protein [Marinococcus luteus]
MQRPSLEIYQWNNDTVRAFFSRHTFSPAAVADGLEKLQAVAALSEEEQKDLQRLKTKNNASAYHVLVCGHFSAGKSTLINRLLGGEWLPAHPVPTSANIVSFTTGSTSSYEVTTGGETTAIPPEEWTNAWMMAGETERVEVNHPALPLPPGVTLFDTPGIDSTEAAHQRAAESEWMVADELFYVTDYQQVESEENFLFLQQLNEQYVRPTLIVNQVDKHEEEELSFQAYQDRIRQSLDRRQIEYEAIFFVSALYPERTAGSWKALREKMLPEGTGEREARIRQTCAARAYYITVSHLRSRLAAAEPGGDTQHIWDTFSTPGALYEALEADQEAAGQFRHWEAKAEKAMRRTILDAFARAKLMPYHTRAVVHAYLESRLVTFRVKSWLGTQKTARVRKEREARVIEELNENIKNELENHLKRDMKQTAERYAGRCQEVEAAIEAMEVRAGTAMLEEAENKGARLTEAYARTYCRTLEEKMQTAYRRQLAEWMPLFLEKARAQKETEALRQETKAAAHQQAWEAYEAWRKEFYQLKELLEAQQQWWAHEAVPLAQQAEREPVAQAVAPSTGEEVYSVQEWYRDYLDSAGRERETREDPEAAADKWQKLARLVQPYAPLAGFARRLEARAGRLREQAFRVSFFGGFSAGKSTVANAMAGETVLPVSANPTTAAITHIKAPDGRHPDRSAVIYYKQQADVLQDMNDLLAPFEVRLSHVTEWHSRYAAYEEEVQERAEKAEKQKRTELEQQHLEPLAFDAMREEEKRMLDQYVSSYEKQQSRAGRPKTVSLEAFQQAAGAEEAAMMIERADVYLSTRWTGRGMEVVDTPGIHSVYQRHADISFQEMKRADAILFLSYYNHAFSRGDKAFLEQLAAVNQTFSYDKLIFLVNAADLAAGRRELEEVLRYVRQELGAIGIHDPLVLPISGKVSLQDKTAGGLEGFEAVFEQFLSSTLETTVMKEGSREAAEVLDYVARTRAQAERTDAEQERERQNDIAQLEQFIAQNKRTESWKRIEKRLTEETEELFFYVRQRLFYYYREEFMFWFSRAYFHDQSSFRSQLRRKTTEAVQQVLQRFLQETRITSARIEQWMHRTMNEEEQYWRTQLPDHFRYVFSREPAAFPPIEFSPPEVPAIAEAVEGEWKTLTHHDFFMNEQNKVYREVLEQQLRPVVEDELQAVKGDVYAWAAAAASARWEQRTADWETAARRQADWLKQERTEETEREWAQLEADLRKLVGQTE